MPHLHFARFASLIALATTFACGDSTSPTAGPLPSDASDDVLTVQGTIALNPRGNSRLLLRAITGEVIELLGDGSAPLDSIVGAQVVAQGEPFGESGMYVKSFLVLAVHDSPARDGVLVWTPAGGYSLNLTAGAFDSRVVSPSPEFQALVGHRVWVIGPEDDTPAAFGVIW